MPCPLPALEFLLFFPVAALVALAPTAVPAAAALPPATAVVTAVPAAVVVAAAAPPAAGTVIVRRSETIQDGARLVKQ